MAQHYVYRFYAELKDYEPKIWRRFEINGEKTMAELGYALMIMFEMQGSHLFCIVDNMREEIIARTRGLYDKIDSQGGKVSDLWNTLRNNRYELIDEEMDYFGDDQPVEADGITLNRAMGRIGTEATMMYDYGDGWEVALRLEECEQQEISLSLLPRVLEGEGFGIIEDVGGTGGLEQFAEAMKRGEGEDFDEYCEWLGIEGFDMDEFDIEDMNFRLKKLNRVYRDIYEHHIEPTRQSLKLLLRHYKGKGPSGY